jgi:hypothetical protein
MENINNHKKRKLNEELIISSIKKQNISENETQNFENKEEFDIEILEVPLEENNSEECIEEESSNREQEESSNREQEESSNREQEESSNKEQILKEDDYDIEDYLIEPDESNDINDYKYGDFMKHIEESDYTANYGENEDGDYES